MRGGEGQMDERIERFVAVTGVDRAAAAKAVGNILQFLRRHAEDADVCIARARHARTAYPTPTDSNSAGMVATLGGGTGARSRVTAVCPAMRRAAGRGVTVRYARAMAGRHAVGEVVGAIPSRIALL
jgi:hypothetical protein